MRTPGTRCPHADIRFCPLYWAAHEAIGIGCDDGKLDTQHCAVNRGMDYGQEVARLCKVRPDMVKEAAEKEYAWESMQQRKRNMRAAGLH